MFDTQPRPNRWSPDGRIARGLVLWFGVYQLAHAVVNATQLPNVVAGTVGFPVPPGGARWSSDVLHFLASMAVVDLVVAIVSLFYVWSFFRRAAWRTWLGTVTTSMSLYASLVFDASTAQSGAWSDHPATYWFINLAFVPVLLLFVLSGPWSVHASRRAEGLEAGDASPTIRRPRLLVGVTAASLGPASPGEQRAR